MVAKISGRAMLLYGMLLLGERVGSKTVLKYRYVGVKHGVTERGTMEADNKAQVAQRLKAQGYTRVRVKRPVGDTGNLFRRLLDR